MSTEPQFVIPKAIDRYLGTLSKLYKRDGEQKALAVIVNAKVRVDEWVSYDNWNGGTYGHAVVLSVSEKLYLDVQPDLESVQTAIKDGLNRLHNEQNEFIAVTSALLRRLRFRVHRDESERARRLAS